MSLPGATFKLPQGEKMQEILEKLQDVSLDPHKEAQIDAGFQESEIILNNLKIPLPRAERTTRSLAS